MLYVACKSTSNHCGSLNALDHRVVALPSTAKFGAYCDANVEDALAGLFSARLVGGGGGGGGGADPATLTLSNVAVVVVVVLWLVTAMPAFTEAAIVTVTVP